jgi:CRISPR/Cas system-associated exonuclease Cas4 (RecB family)
MAYNNSRWTRTAPYKPGQKQAYNISRSKIDLFMNCPSCFWLDRRLKIGRPSSPPFQINKAVDELFKKEFDTYRKKAEPHPLMLEYKIDAIPFAHDDLDTWRENFIGVQYLHKPTGLNITGAVDDVWINPAGELIVVDYKATSKKGEVSLDAPWQISYKRQMEVYQWLLRKNGFEVSNTGYFVYTNGRLDLEGFFDRIEFKTIVIPYVGNDEWIEPVINKIKETLEGDMPRRSPDCEYCTYVQSRVEIYERNKQKKLL